MLLQLQEFLRCLNVHVFFLLEEGEGDVEMNVVVFYLVDFICLFAHLCVQ